MCICIYIYIYTYACVQIYLSLSLSLYVYIYIYIYRYMMVYLICRSFIGVCLFEHIIVLLSTVGALLVCIRSREYHYWYGIAQINYHQ